MDFVDNDDAAYRSKLIRYIAGWAQARPSQYQPRVGSAGLGYTLSLDDLTTEALTRLRERITRDAIFTRRINRENREIYARAKLSA